MSDKDDINFTTAIVAATYTAVPSDYFISVQGATGAVTVNLPAPSAALAGRPFYVNKDAAAQTITIKSPSGNIDGVAGSTGVTLASAAVHGRMLICDGTNYWTVAQL